jgi:hypothetical protein
MYTQITVLLLLIKINNHLSFTPMREPGVWRIGNENRMETLQTKLTKEAGRMPKEFGDFIHCQQIQLSKEKMCS